MQSKRNLIITTEMLKQYIVYLKEDEKSLSTIEKYVRDIKKFISFAQGNPVTKELVIEYKDNLKYLYRPVSINSMLAALNSFFTFLSWDDCHVKRLKIQRKVFCDKKKELSKSEYEKLIEASRQGNKEPINLIIQTICGTGIRVSELKYITVEAVKRRRAVVECKGKIRLAFINKKLQRLLLHYINRRGIKSGSVFVTRRGNPVHRCNIWKEMKALCETAGVSSEKVFPHNLRHLFARTFYGIEKDIVKLADILGHSNIETTRGYIISSGQEHCMQVERLGLVV